MRVSTDRHTHARTDAKRFYYLSHAICYSYGADNNVKFLTDVDCFLGLKMNGEPNATLHLRPEKLNPKHFAITTANMPQLNCTLLTREVDRWTRRS